MKQKNRGFSLVEQTFGKLLFFALSIIFSNKDVILNEVDEQEIYPDGMDVEGFGALNKIQIKFLGCKKGLSKSHFVTF